MANPINFPALSQSLREWLCSEQLADKIHAINARIKPSGEKRPTIARLVAYVATRDLAPENFAAELKNQLNLDPVVASKLAEEINNATLWPVGDLLKNELGIDLNKISPRPANLRAYAPAQPAGLGAPPQPFRPAPPRPVAPTPPLPVRPARQNFNDGGSFSEGGSPFSARSAYVPPQSASVAKMTDLAAPKKEPSRPTAPFEAPLEPSGVAPTLNPKPYTPHPNMGPFILHEEKPMPSTNSELGPNLRTVTERDKRFSFATPPRPDLPTQKPAEAQFGSGGFAPIKPSPSTNNEQNTNERTELSAMPRVVHYTSYRTMLDESGLKKSAPSSTNSELDPNLRTKTNSQKSTAEAEKIKEKIFAEEKMLDKETLLPPG